ncbi:MAG TPA: hypothetical protein VN719_09625 [Gemmatimonadales bacterium]|nr:hypothetical protein [Gemmatimonadales bacterium]
MSTAYSGKDGKVFSGSTDMDVEGWDADVESPDIDVTTTADAGWEDAIEGPIKVSGTFDFLWNPLKDPFNTVVNLMPGAALLGGTYPTLKLQIDANNNYLQGTAKITKLSIKNKVKDAVRFTASFRSKGAWTRPNV